MSLKRDYTWTMKKGGTDNNSMFNENMTHSGNCTIILRTKYINRKLAYLLFSMLL